MNPWLLTINPGSTTTKVALFHGRETVFSQEISHPKEELSRFPRVLDQKEYRKAAVLQSMADHPPVPKTLDAVIGRGGLLRPLTGGVYKVDSVMLDDLAAARYGEHACNLGGIIADELAEQFGCSAYIVDPVVTDELTDLAKYTGLPGMKRRSVFHALSQRAAAHWAAEQVGKRYSRGWFIVAHMGGGISIGAHACGRIVDVTNGLDGEGPFTPERTGALPLIPVLEKIERGEETLQSMKDLILTQGGLFGYSGSNDLRVIEERSRKGDTDATMLVQALAYQVARDIAAMGPALMTQFDAEIDAIVLTGGLARSDMLTGLIRERIRFLGPVFVVKEVEELQAMADGVTRALTGEETVHSYADAASAD
ncbi:MAG: butyrate kinase [Desulfovibrio sp.]|uniref:butyrate kinase n=1 Tax=Desulfovibrio sp. 7SRBS1 TaxID=3378064 RepID=UPI003B41D9CB